MKNIIKALKFYFWLFSILVFGNFLLLWEYLTDEEFSVTIDEYFLVWGLSSEQVFTAMLSSYIYFAAISIFCSNAYHAQVRSDGKFYTVKHDTAAFFQIVSPVIFTCVMFHFTFLRYPEPPDDSYIWYYGTEIFRPYFI